MYEVFGSTGHFALVPYPVPLYVPLYVYVYVESQALVGFPCGPRFMFIVCL